MSDALTIGWSQDQARTRKSVYRKALGFNMLLHVLIGLLCMFAPYFVSETFGLPPPVPTGWISRLGRNPHSRHRALHSRFSGPLALALPRTSSASSGAFGWRRCGSRSEAASSGSACSTSVSPSSSPGFFTAIASQSS